MWIEEHQIHKEIQKYNQVDVLLQTHRADQGLLGVNVSSSLWTCHFIEATDCARLNRVSFIFLFFYFIFQVPELAEGRPSVLKGDVVFIRRKDDDVKFEGVVHIVEQNTIFVAPNES